MRMINIVPFLPDRIDGMAAEADRLYRECGITAPALMLPLYPEGARAADKPEFMAKVFAEWKSKITEPEVRPGILVQSTLGHVESGGILSSEPWRHAVNIHGMERMRMCPLDEGFRAYLEDSIELLAREKPAFMMIDDDFRMLDGLGMECFCPLHVARFNEENHASYSAEELRGAISAAVPGDALTHRYEAMCLAGLEETALRIRQAIDRVDPAMPCIQCGPGMDFVTYPRISRILAGKNPAILRLANATYCESAPKSYYPWTLFSTVYQMHIASSVEEKIVEADTWPHHRFSKSAANLHSQLAGCFLHGLKGAKLWITNLNWPDAATSAPYEAVLARYRHFYAALERLAGTLTFDGVQTVLPRKALPAWSPTDPAHMFHLPNVQRDCFDREGIPGYYAAMDAENRFGVRVITGEIALYLSDDELNRCFHDGLLLYGEAAEILTRRGYAALMGVTASQASLRFQGERVCADGENIAHANRDDTNRLLTICDPATEVVSELISRPFYHAPEFRVVAPAVTFFRNRLGGRVAVLAETELQVSPWRKAQTVALLEKLAGKPLPALVGIDQDFIIRRAHGEAGEELLFAVNLSYDALEALPIRFAAAPVAMERLGDDGQWVPVTYCDGRIEWPFKTLDCALFRWRCNQ